MPKEIESISYIRIGETEHPIDAVSIEGKLISDFQEAGKIVQTISTSSTDEQIPSAKCLYDMIYGSGVVVNHNWGNDTDSWGNDTDKWLK